MIDNPRAVRVIVLARRSPFSARRSMRPEVFERIQQTHDRRAVEHQRGGEIFLAHRHRRAGEMDQRQPGGLGQAERLQAAIHRAPPLPSGLGYEARETVAKLLPGLLCHRAIRWSVNIWPGNIWYTI